jgi:hypothetical protein
MPTTRQKFVYGRACTLWDNHQEDAARALLAPWQHELERLLARDAAGVPERVRMNRSKSDAERRAERQRLDQLSTQWNRAIAYLRQGHRAEACMCVQGEPELVEKLQSEIRQQLDNSGDAATKIAQTEYNRIKILVKHRMKAAKAFESLLTVRRPRVTRLTEGLFDELRDIVAPQLTEMLKGQLPRIPGCLEEELEEERLDREAILREVEESKRYWATLMDRQSILARGWSRNWVRRLLGSPTEVRHGYKYQRGDYETHYYEIAKVLEAEQGETFRGLWSKKVSRELVKNIQSELECRPMGVRRAFIHPLESDADGMNDCTFCRLSDKPPTIFERILSDDIGPSSGSYKRPLAYTKASERIRTRFEREDVI